MEQREVFGDCGSSIGTLHENSALPVTVGEHRSPAALIFQQVFFRFGVQCGNVIKADLRHAEMSKHRARPWRHVAGTFLNTGVYLTFCQRADTRREPRRAQVGARRHPLRRPPAARAPLRRSHGAPCPRHKARPRRGAVRSPQPAGGRRGGRPEVSGPCRQGGTGGREEGCSACRPPGVCRAWAVEGKGGVRSPG